MDTSNESLDAYITDGFERAEKRTNMTWFYPKICNFQDEFPSFEEKENYLDFLDTPPDVADLSSILLYIHIPFCLSFCNFCACYKELSYKWKGEKRIRFISALIKQIEYFSQKTYFRSKSISHIQFGGGSPSTLEPELLEQVITAVKKNFDVSKLKDISFEGSPLTLSDLEYVKSLKQLGINRVSFGVQTFDEKIRRTLAMKASVEQVLTTAENIRIAGIGHFAVDLIYNLPGQDLPVLQEDLNKTVREINPNFIQTYPFNQWQGTQLDKKIREGKLIGEMPTQSRELEQYNYITRTLREYGYSHQLLVNFYAKEDLLSRIGLDHACGGNGYRRSYTLGIGPAAESYLGNHCWRNVADVANWIDKVESQQFPASAGRVASEEEIEDRVMVFFPAFGNLLKSNIKNIAKYTKRLNWLKEKGYITEDALSIRLTPMGKQFAGNIAYLFYSENEKKRVRKTQFIAMKKKVNPFHQDKTGIVI